MTEATAPAAASAPAPGGTHPFDYYYRPGMDPRPSPPAFTKASQEAFDSYLPLRRRMTPPWRTFRTRPPESALTRLVDDHRWQGDEQMDAVVRMFRRIGVRSGRRLLDQALEHGIETVDDPPAELVALFEQLDRIPDWFDAEKFERGRTLWIRSSASGKIGEFFTDMVATSMTYEAGSAIGATGLFRSDPARRYLETFAFFYEVTRRGGMDRFSDAFKHSVRVRLMHAQVRAHLRAKWGEEEYAWAGAPIPNSALAQGVAAFGLAPLLFDMSLGRPYGPDDLDAVTMYWAYIVYVFGVDEAIIPRNADQACELADYMLATGPDRSRWSQEVAQTHIDFLMKFTDSPRALRRRLGHSVGVPLLLGLLAHLLGEPLIREFISSTPYRDIRLSRWAKGAGLLAKADVRAAWLLDTLPGIDRVRRSPDVDPLFDVFFRILRDYAQKTAGVSRPTFESHDHTRQEDLKAARPVG